MEVLSMFFDPWSWILSEVHNIPTRRLKGVKIPINL
jgi:hypothetical protein